MTDLSPLSPAAQAVLDAATNVKHPEIEAVAFQCTRLEVAAALRAAAAVVAKDEMDHYAPDILHDIAAELEGING